MDILTFIAEIAKAAAWPATVVTIALTFRPQLKQLLTRIKKGKIGAAEFEFEERVRELQSESTALQLPIPSTASLPSAAQAEADPRSTVMRAWLEVETAIEDIAKKSGHYNALAARNAPYTLNALRKAEILDPSLVSLYRELRTLRNQAAHELDFNPSADSVVSFVRVSKELEAALRKVESAL